MKATIGARSVLSRLRFSYCALHGISLAYLPLKFLDSLISERLLPLKGLGLMILMQLGVSSSDDHTKGSISEAFLFQSYRSYSVLKPLRFLSSLARKYLEAEHIPHLRRAIPLARIAIFNGRPL